MKLHGVTQRAPGEGVSIHTRHHWRVKRVLVPVVHRLVEVSIHTRHHWRVKHAAVVLAGDQDIVSIHTRHHWRVKLVEINPNYNDAKFQSTPAITGG